MKLKYLNQRKFAVLMTALVLALRALNAERPNVLFIAIDDLNDFVGCMDGAISAPTPNIDRLATEGTLFTNAHCQAPICGPSRASIMTGLLPSTNGIYLHINDNDIKQGNDAVAQTTFLPDYFEQHGYKTMAVGKIYHNGDRAETFDEYGGMFDGHGPRPLERINYDPSKLPHKRGGTSTDWGVFPEYDSMMPDYKCAEWAVKKLGEKHDKPFFLGVGFLRPHVPWYVPQAWFDKIDIDQYEMPPYLPNDLEDVPEMGQAVAEVPQMPTTEELLFADEWKDLLHAYLASTAFVDAQIGKVLNALKESEYADNTIVVLWSDHGYHIGEKSRIAKMSLWERDSRVVLILKEPGGEGNQRSPAAVQLLDMYPTLVEMCGLPQYPLAEGNSLVPLLRNPRTSWEHPALIFYGKGNIAVRDERYRLIQYEDGSQELYDLREDPNEWVNLAEHKKFRRKIKELQKAIPRDWAPQHNDTLYYGVNAYFSERTQKFR